MFENHDLSVLNLPLNSSLERTGFSIFESKESNVRSYCRAFPAVFTRAKGALIYDELGRHYIDFLAGAGALNYGHNNTYIKERLLAYVSEDGISQGLDLYTKAKRDFIESFTELVLKPKGMDYKLQFCGPTGSNAVEAALKIARKATGRNGVFSFMGGYHGMSMGSLAVTGNRSNRAGAGTPLNGVSFMPFPDGNIANIDTIAYIDYVLSDTHSGTELPAAIILETVQGEGGVVVAPVEWLVRLREVCDRYGIFLICDDIQAGCFRTGPFFSFERANIFPDIVTLSKSISGYGIPMSLLLMKPELDVWKPGEHTGTFRGNQLAFVGGTAALELATLMDLPCLVQRKQELFQSFLFDRIAPLDPRLVVRGIGMIWGLDCTAAGGSELAKRISANCFENGLVIETTGRRDAVVKFLPPLTIETDVLEEGFSIFERAIKECLYD